MGETLKSLTKHNRIAEHLKSLILSGKYQPGELIPPETAIAKEFGVNRGTVCKALTFLVNAGLLVRRQGSGTFVSQSLDESLRRLEPAGMSIAVISYMRMDDPNHKANPLGVMFSGVEDSLAELANDCKVSFINTYPEFPIDGKLIGALLDGRVSGVIYMAKADGEVISSNIAALKNSGIPFVLALHEVVDDEVNLVCESHGEFGYLAARHLIGKGHRNIIYVVPEFDADWLCMRIDGFKRAVSSEGIEFSEKMIVRHGMKISSAPDQGRKEGCSAAELILRDKLGCTGIVAVNDAYASGLIDGFKASGVEVPMDISIVGADDDFHFRDMNITTVRQPDREIGAAAASMLLRKISEDSEMDCWEKLFVRPRLIERSTTSRMNGNIP